MKLRDGSGQNTKALAGLTVSFPFLVYLNKGLFMRTTGHAKRIQPRYTRRVPIPPEHRSFLWDEAVRDKCSAGREPSR